MAKNDKSIAWRKVKVASGIAFGLYKFMTSNESPLSDRSRKTILEALDFAEKEDEESIKIPRKDWFGAREIAQCIIEVASGESSRKAFINYVQKKLNGEKVTESKAEILVYNRKLKNISYELGLQLKITK